ncbi:hypothetical protein A2V61_02010 [Candidatus Woesebacteria bacterium RBG_19FT_COMBO_47_8]|nr:MAG: hypothetical protein A2V61_02010 [Candidatus Woesebacteria bacterium RBG_19FT_COMBO_47_8]
MKMENEKMSWPKKIILFMVATILMNGCASLDDQQSRKEYYSICDAIAQSGGGKISKEEFYAAAKDKARAEEVYKMCDPNNTGYITDDVATDPTKVRMMQQVIRMTEPRPR